MNLKGEEALQYSIFQYLRLFYPQIIACHYPSGGFRRLSEARKFKALGVLPGIPDILILRSEGDYHGFASELKFGSNKTTEIQNQVIKKLRQAGWWVVISRSLDQFAEQFSKYMNDKNYLKLI